MLENLKTIVKPDIRFISDILADIYSGKLRVPKFQRPFEWKPQQMIDLFESIEKGYPIGSLLFWKTNKNYKSLDKIGGYQINESPLPHNYILDGHQRLSTLYGVLTSRRQHQNDNNSRGLNDWIWDIYYDLKNAENNSNNFIHIRQNQSPEPHHLPLHSLLNTLDFLNINRKLFELDQNIANLYIERAENLAQAFRDYRIALNQIEGGDLETAVNIFTRLNSTGTKIAKDRMHSALTYRENSFDLSSIIDSIIEKLDDFNFSGIRRLTIFQAILATANKDVYTKKMEVFSQEEKLEYLPDYVKETEKSLLRAIRFLSKRINLPSDKFLPHSLQLVILSEFFRINPEPNEEKLVFLERWFWISSYVGLETTNYSKMKIALNEIRDFASSNENSFDPEGINFNDEARPFPENFTLNSSRVRVFVLFLMSLEPRSLSGEILEAKELLANSYSKAIPYLINEIDDKKMKGGCSNKILIGTEKTSSVMKKLKEERGLFDTNENTDRIFFESHGIKPESINLLKRGQKKEFLKSREGNLIYLEKKFLERKGVKPNSKDIVAETILDSD